MNLLAIETTTQSCSAALLYEGKTHQRFEHQPQKQADLILPMVDGLLADADLSVQQLDGLAFACGPGSFTGLRVASAVVQGIAIATDLPVVPVSTLAVIAQGVYRQHGHRSVLAAIDARMAEVYWGAYCLGEDDLMRLTGLEAVLAPGSVSLPFEADWVGSGSGWRVYPNDLQAALNSHLGEIYADAWPQAQDILTLAEPELQAGRGVAAEQAQPVYLRNNVAKPKSAR